MESKRNLFDFVFCSPSLSIHFRIDIAVLRGSEYFVRKEEGKERETQVFPNGGNEC